MILSVVIASLLANGDVAANSYCNSPQTERDVAVCRYLQAVEKLEIRTVESVAVGSQEQMLALRSQARECGLINRVDHIGEHVSTFDIINADTESKKCLVDWLEINKPKLVFSEERLKRLISAS